MNRLHALIAVAAAGAFGCLLLFPLEDIPPDGVTGVEGGTPEAGVLCKTGASREVCAGKSSACCADATITCSSVEDCEANGSTAFACDDTTKCGDGKVCCYLPGRGGVCVSENECRNNPNAFLMCHPQIQTCPGTQRCVESDAGPTSTFFVCRLKE